MNKIAIKTMLAERGITGVVTTQKLAEILKLSIRTINGAKLKGDLRQIDRNTYDLDSIVEWLFKRPRYMNRIETNNL